MPYMRWKLARHFWYTFLFHNGTILTNMIMYIRSSGKAELARIIKQSALDEGQVKRNLQKLRQRDLVLQYENDGYDIASPIFRAWVERSLYN